MTRDKTIRIEVFKSGTFTPMRGAAISYAASDLAAIAKAYDPEAAPAPLVVGHPTTDAPAYGWVKAFSYDPGVDRLFAEIGEVEPAFAEAVKAGRYKKISMSFFPPEASNNPRPGGWYPKHVGFLGAAAPAVPGLKTVAFSEDNAPVFVAAFGERGFEEAASLFRNIRDFLISKFGLEAADQVLPAYRLEWLDETEAGKPTPGFSAPAEPDPADPTKKDPIMSQEDKAALEKREQDIAVREAAFAERERAAREAENAAFAEQLVSEGRLLPALKAKAVTILNAASGRAEVSFAEGEKTDLADALKTLLKAQPVVTDFSALAPDGGGEDRAVSFASDGKPFDKDQLDTDAKARAYQAQHPGTDYLAAVHAVS